MPYTVVKHNNGKYCVHKKNADGSDGSMLENACHDSAKKAGAQIGAIEHAEKQIKEVSSYNELMSNKQNALQSIAYAYLYNDMLDEGYQIAQKLTSASSKARVLIYIAQRLYHADKEDQAKQLFDEALVLINSMEKKSKSYMLDNLVGAMANCGYMDEALQIAEGMDEKMKEELLKQLRETVKKFAPKSFVTFKQDKAGDWWFIGLYSNKFEDREQEIISEAAHKEYVEWANEKGFQPPVTAYHMPHMKYGFWKKVMTAYEEDKITTEAMNNLTESAYRKYSLARTQHLFYANGFVGVVAKVYPERAEAVKRLSESDYDLAMSHGFTNVKMRDNIFDRYRSFEFSVLLRDRAANVFTFTRVVEGQTVFSDKDKEVLNAIEPGLADDLDAQTAKMSKNLEDGGVAFKEENEEEAPEEDTTPETTEEEGKGYAVLVNRLVSDLGLEDLHKVLQTNFDGIDQRFNTMEQLVKKVQQTEDEQIAAQYYRPDWSKISRPTASVDNLVEKPQGEEKKDTGVPGWSDLALKQAADLAWNVQVTQPAK